MKKRAFTLIELLVVIAIIAILAAILFTVFAKARERAMLTTCISNNKQLGTAFALYTDDTDGKLPHWIDLNNVTWDLAIWNYVKTKSAYTCPSNKSPEARRAKADNPIRSYSFPQNVTAMNVNSFKAPAKTVLLFEKGIYPVGTGADSTGEWFGQTVAGTQDATKAYPYNPEKWGTFHGLGKVFLFADGHAKWFPVVIKAINNDNPCGYYFPESGAGNWPRGANGLGYCGALDGSHAGNPSATELSKGGANLPLY